MVTPPGSGWGMGTRLAGVARGVRSLRESGYRTPLGSRTQCKKLDSIWLSLDHFVTQNVTQGSAGG